MIWPRTATSTWGASSARRDGAAHRRRSASDGIFLSVLGYGMGKLHGFQMQKLLTRDRELMHTSTTCWRL